MKAHRGEKAQMQSVKISDYMATNLVTFKPEDNIFWAMDVFLDRSISGAPVVDADGQLVGMLSEVDLIEVVMQGGYYDEPEGVVRDFMQAPVDTVPADLDIFSVAKRFKQEHRHRFPVLHNGKLVGQISRRDVLRAVREFVERKLAKHR
jgi:CBS domain-containing protein